MEYYVQMTREEVHKQIPYAVICETRFGSRWNTLHRKRRWAQEFTEAERKTASRLFQQAYKWYLTTGVPETVKMTIPTLALWSRLGNFCAGV